jgi:hypothetical protein
VAQLKHWLNGLAAPIAKSIVIEFSGVGKQKGSLSEKTFKGVQKAKNIATYRKLWKWKGNPKKMWSDFLADEIYTGRVRVPSGGPEFPSDAAHQPAAAAGPKQRLAPAASTLAEAAAPFSEPGAPVVLVPPRVAAASRMGGGRRGCGRRLAKQVLQITSSTQFADAVGALCGVVSSAASAHPLAHGMPTVFSVADVLTRADLDKHAAAGHAAEKETFRKMGESCPTTRSALESLGKEEPLQDGPHLVGAQGELDALTAVARATAKETAGPLPQPATAEAVGVEGASGLPPQPATAEAAGVEGASGPPTQPATAEAPVDRCLLEAIGTELAAGKDVEVVFMVHDIKAAGARTWGSLASAQRDKKMWKHLEPAVKAEIERVFEKHESVKHVPATEMAADVAKYGSVKVLLRDALIPIKAKFNAAGEFTKMKARFVVADRVADGRMGDVYAPAVQSDTVRYSVCVELQMKGVSAVKDVEGAYLHGKPLDPSAPRGRALYARVPSGLEHFGYADRVNGMKYLLKIVGNVPGRQDAGVIWGKAYDEFLKADCGLEQSIVDRRLYYKHGPNGELTLVCVYVDDNRIVANNKKVLQKFETAFHNRFPDSLSGLAADVSSDFLGVKYERLGGESSPRMELSCPGALKELLKKLSQLPEGHRLVEGTPTDTPMDERALDAMRESQPGGAKAEELLPPERIKTAQEIAGLAGWITTCARPDGYFAFVALSQYLALQLTPTVWNALLRWAWYLASTPGLRLIYRAGTGDWEMYADSSLFNNANGASFGGYVALFPGSGVFAWKSFVPRKLGMSSGSAETTMAAFAVQYALGMRIMNRELRRDSGRPTVVHTDNLATLQGTAMENVPVLQRYLSARRALVRQAQQDGAVEIRHVGTDRNIADMFTKPLPREKFLLLRAMVLGCDVVA